MPDRRRRPRLRRPPLRLRDDRRPRRDGATRPARCSPRGHRRLLYVVRYPRPRHDAAADRGASARRVARHARRRRRDLRRDPVDDAFARQVAAITAARRRADRRSSRATATSRSRCCASSWASASRYPRDVSLVAFDEPPWAEVLTPPLAVVAPPVGEIARRTWELLRARMEGAGGRQRRIALEADADRACIARPAARGGRRAAAGRPRRPRCTPATSPFPQR